MKYLIIVVIVGIFSSLIADLFNLSDETYLLLSYLGFYFIAVFWDCLKEEIMDFEYKKAFTNIKKKFSTEKVKTKISGIITVILLLVVYYTNFIK